MFKEGNMHGENHGAWKTDIERFDDIAAWAMDILEKYNVGEVFLEGYAFAATGRVFNIAENTAILKYNMWDKYIDFKIIPPTVVKKFATGSGNASKEKMYESFAQENPRRDIKSLLTPRSENIISPLNDVVDAYFILKCGIFNEKFNSENQKK